MNYKEKKVLEIKNNLEKREAPVKNVIVIVMYKGIACEFQLIVKNKNTNLNEKKVNHLLYELIRHPLGVFIALVERRDKLYIHKN